MADARLNVERILGELPKRQFAPVPFHSPEGDCIHWYFENVDCYAERIDAWLTIYREMTTDRMVGFKLKNIRALLDALDEIGLEVRVSPKSWQIKLKQFVGLSPLVSNADAAPYRDVLSEIGTERVIDLELAGA